MEEQIEETCFWSGKMVAKLMREWIVDIPIQPEDEDRLTETLLMWAGQYGPHTTL